MLSSFGCLSRDNRFSVVRCSESKKCLAVRFIFCLWNVSELCDRTNYFNSFQIVKDQKEKCLNQMFRCCVKERITWVHFKLLKIKKLNGFRQIVKGQKVKCINFVTLRVHGHRSLRRDLPPPPLFPSFEAFCMLKSFWSIFEEN